MSLEIGFTQARSASKDSRSPKEAYAARRRILKYLVLGYLRDIGCLETADTFLAEANLTGEYRVCDNVDLDIILQEYCSFYRLKYNKPPCICKRTDADVTPAGNKTSSAAGRRRVRKKTSTAPPREEGSRDHVLGSSAAPFTVTRLTTAAGADLRSGGESQPELPINTKPLSGYLHDATADKKQMAELIYQDIVKSDTSIRWDDIFGLDEAKALLMESVIYPLKYPTLFTGLLAPWKGVLLHGPPGTGKTMLARAVATESRCTFFNITSSTVTSKWRGDSEKMLKILFEMAHYYKPSIIFVDEIESLTSHRDAAGEHEASRRFKSQLLTELDGISRHTDHVFLMATSNLPWEIDPAMLRRLEKRIHISLPDFQTRCSMLESYFTQNKRNSNKKLDTQSLAHKMESYSGSDIRIVCKEAAMVSVRKVINSLSIKGTGIQQSTNDIDQKDVESAIKKTKPISKNLAEKHKIWQLEMGSS